MNALFHKNAHLGTRLNVAGVFSAFNDLWPKCERRFWKLETRYEYVEIDNPSWEAFKSGDFELSRKVLRDSLASAGPFRERVRALGIDAHRVRPVRWPLTRYMEWEFLSYEESVRAGQRISLYPAEIEFSTVGSAVSDFVLFDDYACLLHQYSDQGEIEGALLIDRPPIANELANVHAALAAVSAPFGTVVELGTDNAWHPRAAA